MKQRNKGLNGDEYDRRCRDSQYQNRGQEDKIFEMWTEKGRSARHSWSAWCSPGVTQGFSPDQTRRRQSGLWVVDKAYARSTGMTAYMQRQANSEIHVATVSESCVRSTAATEDDETTSSAGGGKAELRDSSTRRRSCYWLGRSQTQAKYEHERRWSCSKSPTGQTCTSPETITSSYRSGR